MKKYEMIPAIILDSETTDLKDLEPIEVAYAPILDLSDLDLLRLDHHFHSYFKPSKPISLGAMAIHHIMDEDLVNAPDFSAFKFPKAEYMIGHNVDFDWKAIGKPDVKRICTLHLSRKFYPELDSHSLSAMTYFLFRDTARGRLMNAHTAVVDVDLCGSLLRHMIKKLKCNSFDELYQESENARIPTIMPFGKHKGEMLDDVPPKYLDWVLKQDNVDPYLIKAIKNILPF